jgi:hypothetical protein
LWYLGAVLALVGVWWYWTRKLPVVARNLIRVLPAAIALVPWTVEAGHGRLAPAWLVVIFEGVLRDGGTGWRAGAGLIVAVVIAISLVVLMWWRDRKRAEQALPQEDTSLTENDLSAASEAP